MSSTNKRKNKASASTVLMRVAGILLVATLLAVCGSSFLLAKYTTGGNGGDKARVAKFDVDASLETVPTIAPSEGETEGTNSTLLINVSEDSDGKYKVKLTNRSETAVRAQLALDFTTINTSFGVVEDPDHENERQPIISKVIVTVGDGDPQTITVTDNKAVIPDTFAMAAAGTSTGITNEVTFILTIPALTGEDDMGALLAITKSMEGLSGTTDPAMPFEVIATFTQID